MGGVREGGAGSAVGATGREGGGLTVHFKGLCRIDKEKYRYQSMGVERGNCVAANTGRVNTPPYLVLQPT